MKRIIGLCLIVLLLPLCATAEGAIVTVEEAVARAKALLTEVYGLSAENADALTCRVKEEKDFWYIECAMEGMDDPYYVAFDKATGEHLYSGTPYRREDLSANYPGEAAVRDVLCAAEENGWFADWNDGAAAAFMAEIKHRDIKVSGDLARCGVESGYSAARAINDFFINCYGNRAEWSAPVYAWRASLLTRYGFTTADCAPVIDAGKGIRETVAVNPFNGYSYTLTNFAGEAPERIAGALDHPKLAGYEILSGVLVSCPQIKSGWVYDCGLIAFGKGEERMLVMVFRPAGEDEYLLYPFGARALLAGREVALSFSPTGRHFFRIDYPLADGAFERFTVQPGFVFSDDGKRQLMCSLQSYERFDYARDAGVRIDIEDDMLVCAAYQAESAESAAFPRTMCAYLDYFDAAAFPTSLDMCEETRLEDAALPESCAVVVGAHLREKTSTRSASLGQLKPGAIVRVLDTVPGDPREWCHVRAGDLKGYVSAEYVHQDDFSALLRNPPLPVARIDRATALKTRASGASETVMTLKAGYKMHVMATLDDWYYVCIPSGEPDWMMDINGAYGYVRKRDATIAGTALYLDWME